MKKDKPRISFLSKKTNRKDSIESKSSESSNVIDLHKYKMTNLKSNQTLNQEIINIYVNNVSNERLCLFKNNLEFSVIGKGTFQVLFGKIKFYGYDIDIEYDKEEYDFDISDDYEIFSCNNAGSIIKSEEEKIRIIKMIESLNIKKCTFLKENLKLDNDKYSIVYFKNYTKNFKCMTKREFIDLNYNYINTEKYNNCKILNNRVFICGKKNSGKSTFLLFYINKTLSKIRDQIKTTQTLGSHPYLFLIDCDSGQPLLSCPYNVSLIKINKPLFKNYYKEINSDISDYDIIRSLFVSETSPSNNFEDYLNCIQSITSIYNKIENNNNHYLIVNTNGYTSGLGNVINSAINEIIKPDLTYYIKNKKTGRAEKGEDFENFILNEQEETNINIILMKYKINLETKTKITNLDRKIVLIENEFDLKEEKNTKNKNRNKNLYIYANLVGSKFSLNEREFEDSKDDLNLKNILEYHYFISEVTIDDILFSFDFNDFKPQNELDVLFALNGKMVFVLNYMNNFNYEIEKLSNTKVLDISKLENIEKIFYSFAYVVNIDIINRKLHVISNKIYNNKDKNLIFLRTNSTLDKNIQISNESNAFENILIKRKISEKNYFNPTTQSQSDEIDLHHQLNFFSRNKFNIL
jgi:hypothetical protein